MRNAWLFFICCTIAAPCFAVDSTATGGFLQETGSGTNLDTVLENIRSFSGDRLPQDETLFLVKSAVLSSWEKESTLLRARQADHRQTCKEAIRRANRDSIGEVASRCYKDELLQEMNMLKKQQEYLRGLPLVEEALRTKADDACTALIAAASTIIDGIDAGLFETVEVLKSARNNLHSQYRVPFQEALLRVRIDRALLWVTFLGMRLQELVVRDTVPTTEAALCLQSEGELLQNALLSKDIKLARDSLKEALLKRVECQELLTKILE